MKKYKKSFTISDKQSFFIILIPIIILLILLDSRNLLYFFRNGLSFIYEPVAVSGSQVGKGIKDYFLTFSQISDFRDEYNQMKIDIFEKDINNAYYQTILEEKQALEKQLNMANKGAHYLKAKVVGYDSDSIRINVGSEDGVVVGDTVLLGNMFVGIVHGVDLNGSLVILPYSKNSSFEVFISPSGIENGVVTEKTEVFSKAVVKGVGDHIDIENISSESLARDGDIVVSNDKKINQYLIIGRIANISSNPAETSRSGNVIPLIDYSDLMTVFVDIRKEGI